MTQPTPARRPKTAIPSHRTRRRPRADSPDPPSGKPRPASGTKPVTAAKRGLH